MNALPIIKRQRRRPIWMDSDNDSHAVALTRREIEGALSLWKALQDDALVVRADEATVAVIYPVEAFERLMTVLAEPDEDSPLIGSAPRWGRAALDDREPEETDDDQVDGEDCDPAEPSLGAPESWPARWPPLGAQEHWADGATDDREQENEHGCEASEDAPDSGAGPGKRTARIAGT